MTEDMIDRLCRRVPWMTAGTLRTAHGGQDGITPDQRAILGPAGPDGFYLACGFSGTGFKTAPAIGMCMAELILDGRATTVDITPYEPRPVRRGPPARRRASVRRALAVEVALELDARTRPGQTDPTSLAPRAAR